MQRDIYIIRACVTAWLDHVRLLDASIRDLESRIREARARLEGLGVRLDGPSGGASSDALADGVARVLELEEEWSAAVRAHLAEVEAARDLCPPSHVGARAMWLHVAERLTWAEVGRAIGYSEAQARRIADGGARELYGAMPEEFRRFTFPPAQPWEDGRENFER